MNKIRFICVMLFITAVISCNNNSKSTALLQKATEIIEESPKQALLLLDSIANPEAMDKDNYMKYVVANVQAKYKNYKDVTLDTLIFDAEKYFQNKSDDNQAALAHYYAANVHRERKNIEDELTSLFHAEHRSKQANNNLIIAKSQQDIGNSYYTQCLDTLATKYYKSALSLYGRLEKDDNYKLDIYRSIGRASRRNNEIDSANFYYNKGLNMALELDNKYYQMQFYQLLGVMQWEQNKYNNAVSNLNKAIVLTTNKADSTNVFLNLAIVYNSKQQLDSAKYYSSLVEDGLPFVRDKRVLRAIYGALANYNTQIGNIIESNRYNELKYNVNEEIMGTSSVTNLQKSAESYQLAINQKEREKRNLIIFFAISLSSIVFLVIGLVMYIRLRATKNKMQQEIAKIELLEIKAKSQDTKIKGMMGYQNTLQNANPKWQNIQTKVEELAEGYRATEKPELYLQIVQLVNELINNTEEQRSKWAQDYLAEYPFDQKLIDSLKPKEQLLLVLCCCGYSKEHIASIMEIEEKKVHPKKLTLKHILLKSGYSCKEIEQFLFSHS